MVLVGAPILCYTHYRWAWSEGRSAVANRKLLIAALCAACASPAAAGVFVIGSTDARLCYEAADSPLLPAARDVRRCDDALQRDLLSNYEVVATHVNRGILRMRRDQLEEAIADFDAAIQLDPEQPEAYLNKGAALVQRQAPGEAIPLFTVALERNTRRPAVAHYGRAVANEQVGNVRAAYADYRRASELAPDWRAPRSDLARFQVRQR
jgi:tetratricopeptide (TPR) repeat protein